MSVISDLEANRSRYYKLMDNVKSICTYLNNSATYIETANVQLDKFYRIDNEDADKSKLENTVDSINSIYNILITKIIPTISSRISQLNTDISRIHDLEVETEPEVITTKISSSSNSTNTISSTQTNNKTNISNNVRKVATSVSKASSSLNEAEISKLIAANFLSQFGQKK